VEKYGAELRTRGLAESTIAQRVRELVRWGVWLKARKPRPSLEAVDAELVVRYLQSRGAFHSRSTVASAVSSLRCMGEYLVTQGVWRSNPLRWMRGPKMHLHRPLPRRIDREHQKALWSAAEKLRGDHARYQAVCVLAILYGTGLRRGELERLDVADWDREASVLKVDGQKTGVERRVPVGEGMWKCIEGYLPHRHNRLEAASA
jgi:site-specific recombinase XerD